MTNEERLRIIAGRLFALKLYNPENTTELARFEAIQKDVQSR
jgi:hypothetical protein